MPTFNSKGPPSSPSSRMDVEFLVAPIAVAYMEVSENSGTQNRPSYTMILIETPKRAP